MPDFFCPSCKEPLKITSWDLVPSSFPDRHVCSSCGATNMLSRKTILLSLAPSLSLLLAVAFTPQYGLAGSEVVLAIVAAYVAGMPLGIWAARRYGRLVAPYRPLV